MAEARLDPAIRAVFFDAVGTLIWPAEPVWSTYQAIGRRHGADLDEATIRARWKDAFAKQELIDSQSGWQTGELREAERWRTIVRETLRETVAPTACFVELWEWYRMPVAWTIHPEAGMVLGELHRRGLTLGMASNFDARLAEIVRAFPEFRPLAERCVISSIIGWRKPAPEFFQEVARQAGCAASEILFVGDDIRNDLRGAKEAGMRALLLDPDGNQELAERIGRLTEVTEMSQRLAGI